jgi:beta-lactamase regulating signal transducer with metallopeptidase domain
MDVAWLAVWAVQGLAVTALIAVALRLCPRASASARGVAWWSALAGVLALPWLPVWPPVVQAMAVPFAPAALLGPAVDVLPGAAHWDAGPMLAVAWAVWLGSSCLAMAYGLHTLVHWRRRCVPLPRAVQRRLPTWSRVRTEGRRVHVMVSPDVATPCVLGLWRPIIALPPAALRLQARMLDAIVMHEYAHVRRYDDYALFLQHLVRAVAGLHPAVWWITRMLTLEREAACDDWVVRLAASRLGYARCLVAVAHDAEDPMLLAVGMRGARSQLGQRVERLLDTRRRREFRTSWRVRGVVAPATLVITVLVAGVEPAVEVPPLALTSPRRPAWTRMTAHPPILATPALTPLPVPAVAPAAAPVPASAPRIARRRPPETNARSPVEPRGSMAATPLASRTPLHAALLMHAVQRDEAHVLEPEEPARLEVVDPPATPDDRGVRSPWRGLARGSARGGMATAEWATRVGRKVAGAF